MKDIKSQYEAAKNRALQLMQKGQIGAYLQTLRKVNQYQSMIIAMTAN
jgi:hypothetical protein